jgi:sigma-B regulation protein RsbU (phosphoserine phosphatase)
MAAPRQVSSVWIGALLGAGALLALALLAQTVVNYAYVSTNLIRQQARRTAEERVRNVERATRLARPQNAEAYQAILDDLRAEVGEQVAALTLLQANGSIVATTGQTIPMLGPDERRELLADRDAPLVRADRDGRELLVGVFPCRCAFPRQASTAAEQTGTGRLLLEVVLYRDSLSAPFARLRRNAAVSAGAALALLVSVTLIAARFQRYVRGKQLEAQAELARQVQRDLLPGAAAWPLGVDIAADCRPAWQVGGDFYDVVTLPDGRVAFAIGDVSGHGISAALLMGLIHGAMSSPPWGLSEEDPARAAERLNQLLITKSSGDRFASLFWCAYDPASSTVHYVNAGHLPALWLHVRPDGSTAIDRLADGGPVLGVLTTAGYRTVSITAHPGDLLVLFSDGIVEAPSRSGEPFGEERLIAIAEAHRARPSREICDVILAAVATFTSKAAAQDDQTLLVVRLWSRREEEDEDVTDRSRPQASATGTSPAPA